MERWKQFFAKSQYRVIASFFFLLGIYAVFGAVLDLIFDGKVRPLMDLLLSCLSFAVALTLINNYKDVKAWIVRLWISCKGYWH